MKFTRSLGVFQPLTISAFVAVALSLLLKNWIDKDWRPASAVAIFTATLIPLLYIVFKEQAQKLRKDEEAQLNRLDQPQPVFGSTLHGVIFANENGLGITYLPAFEIFLKWEEITGYVLFQKDIETYTKGFTDDWTKPPTLRGRAHTLLITSTRPDMPAIPVEMPKADLEFWSDVIDAGESAPSSLTDYPKKPLSFRRIGDQIWLRSIGILAGVILCCFGVFWITRPGSDGRLGLMFFYFTFRWISQVASTPSFDSKRLDPSVLHTLLRARGQIPDRDTLAAITDKSLWLCRRGQVLDCVPIDQLESVSLEPSDKVGEKPAKLTFNLASGDHRVATLKPEQAASINAQLRELLRNLKFE